MNGQHRLLLDLFHGNKAHVGSTDGLTDRFGVVAIILVVFPIRSNKLWGDQADGMAPHRQFPRPIVGTAAGFDSNETGPEPRDARTQLRPRDPAAQDGVAAIIDPVELKDMLGYIDSETRDVLHVDSLLLVVVGLHCGVSGAHATECGGVHPIRQSPPAAFSRCSEAQRTAESTLRLFVRCGLAGRPF